MGKPTIRDVARLSGVSTASVSYALRPSGRRRHMTEETYAKILAAAEKLGYVPNAAAATLARGHSDVVLIALDTTFVGDVSERSNHDLIEAFTTHGYQPLLYTTTSEKDLLAVATAVRPVGVMHLAYLTDATRAELRRTGARFVFGLTSEDPEDSQRRSWEAEVGSVQVDHVRMRGYDDVVYALPKTSPRLPVAMNRLAGVRARSAELGLPPPRAVSPELDVGAIAEVLAPLLTPERRTAICSFDDRTAIGVLSALGQLGLGVPDRVGVIGAENTAESALIRPALSTVEFNRAQEIDLVREWIEAAIAGQETRLRAEHAPLRASAIQRSTT